MINSLPEWTAYFNRIYTKLSLAKQVMDNIGTDPWGSTPPTVRRFIESRSDYQQLCDEVVYILKKRIRDCGIEVASISSRAKTLSSFLEKLERKSYDDAFCEVTDLAGVRVVALYSRDLPIIEEVIRKDFEIVEKVDKLNEMEVDQFGYGAIHFVIRLGEHTSGARYDDLKELVCEIQTRTVLQDAWAIIQHHLVYKRESDVPRELQRKLNSLAGLFETADDQFQSIRDLREKYIADVRDLSLNREAFLQTPVNADSIEEYLRWRFPDRVISFGEKLGGIMTMLSVYKNEPMTFRDIEEIIEQTKSLRDKLRNAIWPSLKLYLEENYETNINNPTAVTELVWGLSLLDENILHDPRLPILYKEGIMKLRSGLSSNN
jgi:ppGpp synthetase/RelA/SpoT-type nucleotidyltranferase